VAGTQATSDDGSWYLTYDGWVVAGTQATTIDRGLYGQSWISLVLIYDGYTVVGTRPTVSRERYYDYKNDSRYSVHEGIGSVLGLRR